MHGLIFFFAFAHFARLDNFAVYVVVYAVYFFLWAAGASRASGAKRWYRLAVDTHRRARPPWPRGLPGRPARTVL
jgi:hypothetical protein